MKFIAEKIDFTDTIFNWLKNDKASLLDVGFSDRVSQEDLYAGIIDFFYKGEVYRIERESEVIGFALIEKATDKQGVFHLFLLPAYHNAHIALELVKYTFDFCFNTLNFDQIFTYAKGRQETYLNWSKRMTNENRRILGYAVFSLKKENYLCPQPQV